MSRPWQGSATVRPADAFVFGPVGADRRRPGRRVFVTAAYFLFVLALVTLFATLATSPDAAAPAWAWFNDQHAVIRVVGWIVLLPFTAAVAIWESFLPLVIRWAALAMIGFLAIVAYAPKDA